MLYKRCTGIYKFGNNTYPRRIRGRSNLRHIFQEKSASYGSGNTVLVHRPPYPTRQTSSFHLFTSPRQTSKSGSRQVSET